MTGADQSIKAVRVRVSGRVQGVWYRSWTVERAALYGLSGWVRNRADGSTQRSVQRGALQRTFSAV